MHGAGCGVGGEAPRDDPGLEAASQTFGFVVFGFFGVFAFLSTLASPLQRTTFVAA
jgi:hypothetical protein